MRVPPRIWFTWYAPGHCVYNHIKYMQKIKPKSFLKAPTDFGADTIHVVKMPGEPPSKDMTISYICMYGDLMVIMLGATNVNYDDNVVLNDVRCSMLEDAEMYHLINNIDYRDGRADIGEGVNMVADTFNYDVVMTMIKEQAVDIKG